jgi:FtsP/CotA-like multicopper oxidase with cupredoxin domain
MDRRKFLYSTAATTAVGMVPGLMPFLAGEAQKKTAAAADYTLTIAPLKLELAPKIVVDTIAYNGTVPGPLLRLQHGKTVNIRVVNQTANPELLHCHGLTTDPINDGAMEQGSPMIAPNGELTYTIAPALTGSRYYHTHTSAENDLTKAMYTGQFGFLYVDPKQDAGAYDHEVFLAIHHWEPSVKMQPKPVSSMEVSYQYASFNGKMFSASEPLRVKKGDRVLFHFLNASATQEVSLGLPAHRFRVIALDGNVVPRPKDVNTLSLGVAERVDAIVTMDTPGVWMLGALDEATRNMGLALPIEYAGSKGPAVWKAPEKDDFLYTLFGNPGSKVTPDEVFPMLFEKQTGEGPDKLDLWTINGKRYPEIESLKVKKGKRYRLAITNRSPEPHPVHLHRHSFELITVYGVPTRGLKKDVINIGRYDIVEIDFIADNPGKTLFHCHQQMHMDLGFMQLIEYV